jgi:hypothetical protein
METSESDRSFDGLRSARYGAGAGTTVADPPFESDHRVSLPICRKRA